MRTKKWAVLVAAMLLIAMASIAASEAIDSLPEMYYNPDGGTTYHLNKKCPAIFAVRYLFRVTDDRLHALLRGKGEICVTCANGFELPKVEKTGKIASDLYYNPDGGTMYHGDPECNGVNEKYLPLKPLTIAMRVHAPFSALKPCSCAYVD